MKSLSEDQRREGHTDIERSFDVRGIKIPSVTTESQVYCSEHCATLGARKRLSSVSSTN